MPLNGGHPEWRPGAARVRVAAVAEPRPPWSREIEILFASLRARGGRLAGAEGVAYFVGTPPDSVRTQLTDMGVHVRVTDPIDPRIPHANKLRMFEEPKAYDVLCALDTDVLVAGDFSAFLNGRLRAKAVDVDPVLEWEEIYEAAGLPFPKARVITTTQMHPTVPYFNSGVLFVPSALVDPLRENWLTRLQMPMAWPSVVRHPHTRDQIALALALSDIGAECQPLPVAANFPTHVPTRVEGPDTLHPKLVHYHHRLSRFGEILPTGYKAPDAAIADANKAVNSVLNRRVPPLPYALRVAPGKVVWRLQLHRARNIPRRLRRIAKRTGSEERRTEERPVREGADRPPFVGPAAMRVGLVCPSLARSG